jgi:putative endonuclease
LIPTTERHRGYACTLKMVGGKAKVTQKTSYYVYILLCKDGSYYTGYAKNVEKRLEMHKKGHGARYTKIHEPEKLVYVEEFESRGEAMRRERQIKTFSHNKKRQLIADDATKSI